MRRRAQHTEGGRAENKTEKRSGKRSEQDGLRRGDPQRWPAAGARHGVTAL